MFSKETEYFFDMKQDCSDIRSKTTARDFAQRFDDRLHDLVQENFSIDKLLCLVYMNTKYQSQHNHLLYNCYLWATCFDSLESSSECTIHLDNLGSVLCRA